MNLKMYGLVNIFMYLLGPTKSITCIVLALLLAYLSNIPYKNTKIFKSYWKQFVMGKANKRSLSGCAPFSINAGPYGKATSILGMSICDDIIQNTVTMLLLDGI